MQKIVCRVGWGFDPAAPTGGAYSDPRTIAFRGPTSKRRKVEERKGKVGEGRHRTERKGREGMGKEGRERKGVRPAHFSDASAAYGGWYVRCAIAQFICEGEGRDNYLWQLTLWNLVALDTTHEMQNKLVSQVMIEISRDGWILLFIPIPDNGEISCGWSFFVEI